MMTIDFVQTSGIKKLKNFCLLKVITLQGIFLDCMQQEN